MNKWSIQLYMYDVITYQCSKRVVCSFFCMQKSSPGQGGTWALSTDDINIKIQWVSENDNDLNTMRTQ